MPPGTYKRYNRWKAYEQKLKGRKAETRYIREIIFGKRRRIRYYQVSKREVPDPTGDESWYIMTNLKGDINLIVAPLYSLRNWIEYAFKQVKNELGWADFRVTDYSTIERWWELVMSSYFLVSIQANYFRLEAVQIERQKENQKKINRRKHLAPFLVSVSCCAAKPVRSPQPSNDSPFFPFSQHRWWESGTTWKSALNNLRLILQPYLFYCLTRAGLEVFNIPEMRRGFLQLINLMEAFQGGAHLSWFLDNSLEAIAC